MRRLIIIVEEMNIKFILGIFILLCVIIGLLSQGRSRGMFNKRRIFFCVFFQLLSRSDQDSFPLSRSFSLSCHLDSSLCRHNLSIDHDLSDTPIIVSYEPSVTEHSTCVVVLLSILVSFSFKLIHMDIGHLLLLTLLIDHCPLLIQHSLVLFHSLVTDPFQIVDRQLIIPRHKEGINIS